MYKFIKIRHDTIKQCHGNYKEKKNSITVEHTYDVCPKYSKLESFGIIAYLYVVQIYASFQSYIQKCDKSRRH